MPQIDIATEIGMNDGTIRDLQGTAAGYHLIALGQLASLDARDLGGQYPRHTDPTVSNQHMNFL